MNAEQIALQETLQLPMTLAEPLVPTLVSRVGTAHYGPTRPRAGRRDHGRAVQIKGGFFRDLPLLTRPWQRLFFAGFGDGGWCRIFL